MTLTLAHRFCTIDPDLAGAMADADEARWQPALDDSAEITFSDGSVASCLNGGAWLPCGLAASDAEVDAAARWLFQIDPGPKVDLDHIEHVLGEDDEPADWVGWEADAERRGL